MHDKAPAPWHHTSSLFFGYTPTFPTSSLLDGILEYSHVWIIFQFHLNPRNKIKKSNGCSNTFTASKVRPPRANGKKVGVCLGDTSTSSTQSRGTLPCLVGTYNCSKYGKEKTNVSCLERTRFGRRHARLRHETVCSMGSNWMQCPQQ
jgi:hypothetical protein